MSKPLAVITGASRGLGLATARALGQQGMKVILGSRSAEKAAEAAAALRAEGLDAEGYALDGTSDASVDAFFGWLQREHGRLDVLVNNAGAIVEAQVHKPPLDIGADVLAEGFNTNALSAWRTIQRAMPLMKQAGHGRIVNVSSGMAGLSEMNGGWPAYRLSKAALNAITRVAHAESPDSIKVNSVCPGWVRTEMGGPNATRSVEEGIAGIVWAATLPDDGPSGGFFRDGKPLAW